jgi:hypothetical protein
VHCNTNAPSFMNFLPLQFCVSRACPATQLLSRSQKRNNKTFKTDSFVILWSRILYKDQHLHRLALEQTTTNLWWITNCKKLISIFLKLHLFWRQLVTRYSSQFLSFVFINKLEHFALTIHSCFNYKMIKILVVNLAHVG